MKAYEAEFSNTTGTVSNKTLTGIIATIHNTYMHITICSVNKVHQETDSQLIHSSKLQQTAFHSSSCSLHCQRVPVFMPVGWFVCLSITIMRLLKKLWTNVYDIMVRIGLVTRKLNTFGVKLVEFNVPLDT